MGIKLEEKGEGKKNMKSEINQIWIGKGARDGGQVKKNKQQKYRKRSKTVKILVFFNKLSNKCL